MHFGNCKNILVKKFSRIFSLRLVICSEEWRLPVEDSAPGVDLGDEEEGGDESEGDCLHGPWVLVLGERTEDCAQYQELC